MQREICSSCIIYSYNLLLTIPIGYLTIPNQGCIIQLQGSGETKTPRQQQRSRPNLTIHEKDGHAYDKQVSAFD